MENKKYAVVLAWNTESDEGVTPVLVGVTAINPFDALSIAVKKAVSGNLYSILYTGEPKQQMVIDVHHSFACEVSALVFIN